MINANLRKALFAAALVAGLGSVPFAQVYAQDSTAASAKGDNQTVAGKVDDTWITTKVKSEFTAKKALKNADLSATTSEGAVTVTGTVVSAKQKSSAEKIVKSVKGVKSVDVSGVTVAPAAGAK